MYQARLFLTKKKTFAKIEWNKKIEIPDEAFSVCVKMDRNITCKNQ